MFKEDIKTELKSSTACEEEILETICAFSNTEGGVLYIGIDDSGLVIGVEIGKRTLEKLSNTITQVITPPVYPQITEMRAEEKTIISIEVQKSEHKPHFYKGRAYKRIGKTNKVIDPLELGQLYKEKFLDSNSIDKKQLRDFSLSEIDGKSLGQFVGVIGKKYSSAKNALANLGLLSNGKVTNSAMLFFGAQPANFFPLYGVKCGVFRNNEVLEMQDFKQNIFTIIDPVVDYIASHIPTKLHFDKAQRYETPIVPREALREAIINAVIHRDYLVNSSIFVKILEDKIEVKNPGMLPAPLEINDLYRPHESIPRNPKIAELAHSAKIIEHWGSGTTRILDRMRQAGLDDPTFSQTRGYFTLLLPLKEVQLNQRQKQILAILQTTRQATFATLKKQVSAPERTLRRDISQLVKRKMLYTQKKGTRLIYSTTR